MEKKKLSLSTRLICADAAGVIDALAEGLKERCLRIQKGDETLVLEPTEAVDLEIEAKVKDGRAKIEVEISWRMPKPGPDSAHDDEPAEDPEEVLIDAAELAAEEVAASTGTAVEPHEKHKGEKRKAKGEKAEESKGKKHE